MKFRSEFLFSQLHITFLRTFHTSSPTEKSYKCKLAVYYIYSNLRPPQLCVQCQNGAMTHELQIVPLFSQYSKGG